MSSTERGPKDIETIHCTPEKKKGLTKTQKMIGAGIILVALVGGGLAYNIYQNNQNTTSSETEKQPSIPDEAKGFVSEFGNRYANTNTAVSTYYAEKAYESQNGNKDLILSDSYINNFEISGHAMNAETAKFGFTEYQLPLDVTYNQETSMKVFNEYTSKELSLYMNYIAKNPSAFYIIDSQFSNYCVGINSTDINPVNQSAITASQGLLATAKSIVAEYGSNANYTVAPASNEDNAIDSTQFSSGAPVGTYHNIAGQNSGFTDFNVDLLINIDLYNGKNVSGESKVLKQIVLETTRIQILVKASDAPATYIGTYTSSERIAIGQHISQN